MARETHLTHSGYPRHLDVVTMFLHSILSEEQKYIVVFTALAVFARFNEAYGNHGGLCYQTVYNMRSQTGYWHFYKVWKQRRTADIAMILFFRSDTDSSLHLKLHVSKLDSLPLNQERFISVLRGFSPCLWNTSSVPRKLEEVAEYKVFPVK